MTVHVSIGNSDNRLTQRAWSTFCQSLSELVQTHADTVHGEFYTLPSSAYQSACFSFEAEEPSRSLIRRGVAELGREYDQHSVAWNESDTELL